MISVIIPTLDAAARLSACLEALAPAAADGLVKEVIVVDGGSTDATGEIAKRFGANVLTSAPGRGGQLSAGADAATGDWLLFLHGDTVLEAGWAEAVKRFIDETPENVAVFTLGFDAGGLAPRLVAAGAMLRARLFKSPYGDQGLLISRPLYEAIGGYRAMPLFEDVDIVRRLIAGKGSGALRILKARAVTSAERYERDGYLRRVLKNAWLLLRYHAGASPEALARSYR